MSNAAETANTVTIGGAKERMDEILASVEHGQEWLIIGANGHPVARLTPPDREPSRPVAKRWKAFGMLKGQIEVAPDFDEPLEDLKPYME